MRIVGYVREPTGQHEGESAYSQAERIRRWVRGAGSQLVAVCQDVRTPGHLLGREGFRAAVGIIEAGRVDAVIVAGLEALAQDKVIQEIMMWDLRGRGVTVLSTEPGDVAVLADPPADRSRMFVRDVLTRVTEHQDRLAEPSGPVTVIEISTTTAADLDEATNPAIPTPETGMGGTDGKPARARERDLVVEILPSVGTM